MIVKGESSDPPNNEGENEMFFHGTDNVIEAPKISPKNTLCLTDDLEIARLYQRGGVDVQHRVYVADWDSANIATEAELAEIADQLGMGIDDRFDGQPYMAMKNVKIRQAVADVGFDGVEYEDTHDGCNYQTTELLREPEGFCWSIHEEQTV
jgi:hypothetical protein